MSKASRAEWRALAAVLVEAGTLTASDLRALELLADTLTSCAEFAAIIARDGVLITGPSGAPKAHPAVAGLGQARAQARQLLQDFGLTPAARGGVEAAPAPKSAKPDPLDEFAMAG